MRKIWLLAILMGLSVGCTPSETTDNTNDTTNNNKGNLSLVANGEDFVRQGFVSKDGWQINFDAVYITVADVTAYSTQPPFNPETSNTIEAQNQVVLVKDAKTIDLAEGESNAPPILVNTVEAPPANYNAISWQLSPTNDGPASNKTILLDGMATKNGQTIDFKLGLNKPLKYTCGEFVGDERKGILQENSQAEVEITLHFDHIFGDAETEPDDPLNVKALGFDPIANLADNGKVEVDEVILKEKLKQEDYQKLLKSIAGLGHVGEGHCQKN